MEWDDTADHKVCWLGESVVPAMRLTVVLTEDKSYSIF